MVPVLEFVPPLPSTSQGSKYTTPELYLICGDDRFETSEPKSPKSETPQQLQDRLGWYDSFYDQPVCRKCFAPTGRRNNRPVELSEVASSCDSAFGRIAPRSTITIVSDEFLGLLSEGERVALSFRQVVRKNGRRRFFELLGPSGPPLIGVTKLPVSGWRCAVCNRASWGYWIEGLAISEFVARRDVPDPLPSLFTIGHPPDVQLCVTAARWAELVGRKGTRGMTSRMLGVVDDDEVVRNVELQVLHGT